MADNVIVTVVANKSPEDSHPAVIELGSPDRMLPSPTPQNDRILSTDFVTSSESLIITNPALTNDTVKSNNNKVRLTWDNLSVDAILPPPSCFSKLKGAVTGNSANLIGNTTKTILRNVSGVAEPGSLLAIMGASGAGKTTLLNVLSSQNRQQLKVSGSIRVNDQNIKNKIKSMSAYVQQEDVFIGTLTVKEHLTFQALLRMDDSYTREEKKKRVNDVMAELGLLKCQNTIIGVPGRIRGISGGENKRLSFASEIITNPDLLFVDEPTSGLDAFMAESVIRALQEIVKEGKTVLATIHQPSSEVFELFDKLLLMSEGRTAFLGDTAEALTFFSSVGHPCPVNYNPADHYIHTLAIMPGNVEECKEKSKKICDAYDEHFVGRKQAEVSSSEEVEYDIGQTELKFKMPYFQQLSTVLWRSSKSNIREPFIAKLRIIQAVFISLIAGLVYLQQDNDQASIYNLNGVMFFAITTMSFNSITSSLFVFPAELPVFLKEHKLGMYRTSVYCLSKTLAELPWYIVSTFIFSCIVYWMSGLRVDAASFFMHAGVIQLVAQCALSLGYLVSALSPTVQVATALGPVIMMPFLLFGGFFVKDDSIPPYFIPLKYISWFKYTFESLQIIQWDGFGPIECKTSDKVCIPNGNVVLATNNYDPDNFGLDIGVTFALMVGFRLLAFMVVMIRAARTK